MNMGELKVKIQKILILSNVGFDSTNTMLWELYFEGLHLTQNNHDMGANWVILQLCKPLLPHPMKVMKVYNLAIRPLF